MSRRRPWWKPRPSRRSQRWALGTVAVLLVGAGLAAHGAYAQVERYPTVPTTRLAKPVTLEIPTGSAFPSVLRQLVDKGVLAPGDATPFRVFVLHRGAAGRVTAGEHTFTPGMTPEELLEELTRRQRPTELTVTIPEGQHMLQVARRLADAGLGDAVAFEAAMRDEQLLADLEIEGETAEGYLFPDTYKFSVKADPAEVIRKMVGRHRQVYSDLARRHRANVKTLEQKLEFTERDIVTLASIVEKETGAEHERPIIAGVFLNRLQFSSFQPKLLQTDPTIIYGCTVPTRKSAACQKFEGRIRRIHLNDTDNVYNTYRHEGLPPGPISNPGRAALQAVLDPDRTRFLYFVARNDGTHQFSRTVAEHETWVDLYQRKGAVGDGSAAGSREDD